MEKISYLNQPNCYRLSNETVELVVTTDVGPRILRYAFLGGENILGEVPDVTINTELGEWKPWGGHRLWTAPEAMPRSYVPDNSSVEFEILGERSIRLRPPVEAQTGVQKELTVTLDEEGSGVLIEHHVINRNLWGIEVAPWALTIMRGGGEAILPQEPYLTWDECFLPARPLVLWHYTNLNDARWTIGQKYIRLMTDEALPAPQKIGVGNRQGWAAYRRLETLFVKCFAYEEGASYPDFGSNTEVYTAGSFIEVETLAPLARLEPGAAADHAERWHLFRNVTTGADEDSLDASIAPLIAQTA